MQSVSGEADTQNQFHDLSQDRYNELRKAALQGNYKEYVEAQAENYEVGKVLDYYNEP